jgi:hypothetical protein
MRTIGGFLKILGSLIFTISGIWSFFLCIGIISKAAGFWGIVAGLLLGPVTFVAAPLYAGFAQGDWFPLVLGYGGGISAAILIGIGGALADR